MYIPLSASCHSTASGEWPHAVVPNGSVYRGGMSWQCMCVVYRRPIKRTGVCEIHTHLGVACVFKDSAPLSSTLMQRYPTAANNQ